MLLRWRHAAKRRYYVAHLSRDLFGDWRLVRAWGSLDSALGRVSSEALDDYEAAAARLAAAERRRVQRGYVRAQ